MQLISYAKTLILAAIVLFLTLPKNGGFWLVLATLFFALWALYNLVRLILKPVERRARVMRVAIWIAVLAVAGAMQAYWANASRDHASAAAKALLAYKSRTGSYPSTLVELGLDEQALKNEWRLGYKLRDGKPELNYPASLMPLTMYEYDFATKQWKANVY